jgi:exodeoxyribonuclease V alpha subunit
MSFDLKRERSYLASAEEAQQRALISAHKPTQGGKVELSGECSYVYKRGDHGGWGFGRLSTPKGEITFNGALPEDLYVGARCTIEGAWQQHPRYGWQVKLRIVEVQLGTDEVGVIGWFEARFDDIGPIRARALVRHFGAQLWEVVETAPTRLTEVSGIGEKLAESIAATYQNFKHERELYTYLAKIGLGAGAIKHATQRWGRDAKRTLEENPYALRDLPGVSFPQADRIARNAGIKAIDLRRVIAGYAYAMELLEREGHTCSSVAKIQAMTAGKDVLNIRLQTVQQHWTDAVVAGGLVEEFGAFARKATADAEHMIAEQIFALRHPGVWK